MRASKEEVVQELLDRILELGLLALHPLSHRSSVTVTRSRCDRQREPERRCEPGAITNTVERVWRHCKDGGRNDHWQLAKPIDDKLLVAFDLSTGMQVQLFRILVLKIERVTWKLFSRALLRS